MIFQNKAYLESAEAIGYRLSDKKDVYHATSYPLGEMIKAILQKDLTEIHIGLGGSITNDMGSGMLSALGMRFLDINGKEIFPYPDNLNSIKEIDSSAFDKRTINLSVFLYEDVKNPLLGPDGATYRFAIQKGARKESLPFLEQGMRNLNEVYTSSSGRDHSEEEGTGAAGGLSMAFLDFFRTKTLSGSRYFLSHPKIKDAIRKSDLLFTGEGRIDSTSFEGKGSVTLLKEAEKLHTGIRSVLLVGSIEEEAKRRLKKEYPHTLLLTMCSNAMDYPIGERRKKAEEIFRKTIELNLSTIQDMIE